MSNLDRGFAILSLLAFAGFLAILIYFVPKPGLVVVSVASVLMCGYDFLRSNFIRRWRERNSRPTVSP
jgi:hypothetical protein